ncbi:MAG TPA: diguanylate cyclase [Anaerolineales bacterium]|nr:diguanylate cyclase [Anaerolineales bacterium]HMZ43844.1 diguanylate cyclase [Anaerolineales bacterium]HNC89970.1 diguanylate cyclase [Anaerolineales bacterium]HNH79275.1 diguanylate cyclase [Anaerolineales bacterium]
MDIRWIIFGVILVINSIFAITTIVLITRKFDVAGRDALIMMLCSLAIWSFAYAMITFSSDLETKKFWLRVENVGILSQPVFWIVFILGYSRQGRALNWGYIALLSIVPAVSMIMIASDRWFHLYYSSVKLLDGNYGPLVIERGPWYGVAVFQAYALDLIATILLIWRFIQFRNIFRTQLVFLIVAALIPLFTNIGYQVVSIFLPSLFLPVDLTPISFTLSISLISSGIFRTRLLDLVPIARDVVMEHIPEMVFVVDAHDRVLDVNTVAEKWLGMTRDQIIGKDPIEIFGKWPDLYNRFLTTEKTREEVKIYGDPPLTLEVVITPLYNNEKINGRVVLAYDITKRKQLELDLKAKIIEIDSLRVQLQDQAIRDSLTGVFNRRFLAEALEREIAKANREDMPISIVMMDVDHFKSFNDTYGHKCGDAVLRDLAGFLTKNSRHGDIVCRYGGEEFVILMPEASFQNAFERAQSWQQAYASKTIEYEDKALKVTFSAGVASYPQHGPNGETILHAADHALYESKSNGRNRVTAFQKRLTKEN